MAAAYLFESSATVTDFLNYQCCPNCGEIRNLGNLRNLRNLRSFKIKKNFDLI